MNINIWIFYIALFHSFILIGFNCRLEGAEAADEIFQDGRYFRGKLSDAGIRQIGGYSLYSGENGSGVIFRSYKISGVKDAAKIIIDGFRESIIKLGYEERKISGEVLGEPVGFAVYFVDADSNMVFLRVMEIKHEEENRFDIIFSQIINK